MSKNFKAFFSKVYHENSKLYPRSLREQYIKEFPITPEKAKFHLIEEHRVERPKCEGPGLYYTLYKRRSSASFEVRSPINFSKIESILANSYGVTSKKGKLLFKSCPSGGARYPIYLYLINFNIIDLKKGIYIYYPEKNVLGLLREGDFRTDVKNAIVEPNQKDIDRCSFITVSVSNFEHSCEKYGERGYRLALLDCGHLSQNLYLTSTAEGVACRAINGFYDDEFNNLLDLNNEFEEAVLIHVFGIEQKNMAEQIQLNEEEYFRKET
jgi:SagB-type dehydrogenase family enzyme